MTRHHRADPRRISEGRGRAEEEPRCYEARAIAHGAFIKDLQRHASHALRWTRGPHLTSARGRARTCMSLPIVSTPSGHLRIMDLSVKAPPASSSGPFPTGQSGPDNEEKAEMRTWRSTVSVKDDTTSKSHADSACGHVSCPCASLCEKRFVGYVSRGFSRQSGDGTRECKHF